MSHYPRSEKPTPTDDAFQSEAGVAREPDYGHARNLRRREYRWALRLAVASILAAMILTGSAKSAFQNEEGVVDREYEIKAAYLYQFGRYVQWPAKMFDSDEAPLEIGLMEKDPIFESIDRIARTKKVQDRAIRIRRFATVGDIRPCHIMYFSDVLSHDSQADAIRKLQGTGGLFVGSSANFLERGGIVQFTVEENRIRMLIARKAAQREGLTISAKLLQIARVGDAAIGDHAAE